ncbi:MAG: DUF624 domain-containing protein [Mogibacterium sp.]|nr:DUF624 domain-containing protein [Mogibacterium sp.]
MDKFFDSDNPVMKFLARLVDLVVLNVITILYSIPVVTAGGALTAMNYVLFHLNREDESYVIKMFRKSFRANFKQGIPEGLLALAAAGITAVDLLALHGSESRLATLMMISITIIAVLMFVTCVYMFALQSRYENTVRGTILNAVRLAIGNLPRSAGMAAIWLVWILLLVFLNKAASLFFLIFGLSLPGYLCTMLYDRIFEDLESEQ